MFPRVQTLRATGANGQENTLDVVLGRARSGTLVFFPGDISAGREEMKADEESKEWIEWSTESLALLLALRFQQQIVVVRASRMRQGYACYDHFLTTNLNGDPLDGEYKPGNATHHLLCLLQDLACKAKVSEPQLLSSLHLLAFSKGCVVLNQILAELGEALSPRGSRLLEILNTLAFLDPGVNEGPCVFFTEEEALRRAAKRFKKTQVYVAFSPYQLALESYDFEYEDEQPGTSEELGLELFQAILQEEEVPFELEHCCFDKPPSMETHFQVLKRCHLKHLTEAKRFGLTRAITNTLSRSCALQ